MFQLFIHSLDRLSNSSLAVISLVITIKQCQTPDEQPPDQRPYAVLCQGLKPVQNIKQVTSTMPYRQVVRIQAKLCYRSQVAKAVRQRTLKLVLVQIEPSQLRHTAPSCWYSPPNLTPAHLNALHLGKCGAPDSRKLPRKPIPPQLQLLQLCHAGVRSG